jgi:hypothetical protein
MRLAFLVLGLAFLVLLVVVSGNDAGSVVEIGMLK